jgi:hypothetical protein
MPSEPRIPNMELDPVTRPADPPPPAASAAGSPEGEPKDDLAFPLTGGDVLAKYRERRSWGRKLALGLVGVLVMVGVLAPVIVFLYIPFVAADEGLGQLIVVNQLSADKREELFHVNVSEAEARRLIDFLIEEGIFQPREARPLVSEREAGHGKTVQLSREGDVYVVSFVVVDVGWDDPEFLEELRELRGRLSRDVFGGQPVEVRLCERVVGRSWLTTRPRLVVRKALPAE